MISSIVFRCYSWPVLVRYFFSYVISYAYELIGDNCDDSTCCI